MLVVLADRESKEVLLEYACDPEAFDACVVEAIKDVVSEHGKPSTIYVFRDYSADSLCDLAHWGEHPARTGRFRSGGCGRSSLRRGCVIFECSVWSNLSNR